MLKQVKIYLSTSKTKLSSLKTNNVVNYVKMTNCNEEWIDTCETRTSAATHSYLFVDCVSK